MLIFFRADFVVVAHSRTNCLRRHKMSFTSLVRTDVLFSRDDRKAFVTFKGCMESKIASAGRGTYERPFDQLFWFNEI